MIRGALNILEKSLDNNISVLPSYFQWLPAVAPTFSLHGDQISILNKPEDFYNTLLEKCRTSKKRIGLASLYLGTGPLEKQLVKELEDQVLKEDGLEISILLDANRGSRGNVNSRHMLLPLLKKHPNTQVSLFHTPSLRGPLRLVLPERYNELVGLQHMKLYLFDDSLIISGANLSEDYFTNRQDRYVLVSDCRPLADFYWGLLHRMSSVSLALDSSNNLSPRSRHPYKAPKQSYIAEAKEKIWGFYNSYLTQPQESKPDDDTWIWPLVELPPLGVHHDSVATARLLTGAPESSKITLSTGYFNLTHQYSRTIISNSSAQFSILMAHPNANGFGRAGGLARGIPGAYTGLARNFLRRVTALSQEERICMLEWSRPGWTFHAKGLWFTPPSSSAPTLTLIGSSNFGARSVSRDLEMQVAMVTQNPGLQERLSKEEASLLGDSTKFTLEVAREPERKPALWVLTTMWIFKTFF